MLTWAIVWGATQGVECSGLFLLVAMGCDVVIIALIANIFIKQNE